MRIVYTPFNFRRDWKWVNDQIPILYCEDTAGIMAMDADQRVPVGACLMDNWTNNSVQCHFMLTTPMLLKHGFLEECFGFIFKNQNVNFVYGLVPANNDKAVKLNTHMGFTVKTRLEEAYDVGTDYLLMQLKREDCKYITELREAA
jgi:hypothetical protein